MTGFEHNLSYCGIFCSDQQVRDWACRRNISGAVLFDTGDQLLWDFRCGRAGERNMFLQARVERCQVWRYDATFVWSSGSSFAYACSSASSKDLGSSKTNWRRWGRPRKVNFANWLASKGKKLWNLIFCWVWMLRFFPAFIIKGEVRLKFWCQNMCTLKRNSWTAIQALDTTSQKLFTN